MTTTTTAATSWGADAIRPRPLTRAQKTEQASKAEQDRLAALPVQCQAYADVLDLDALDAMGEVARLYKAEGYAPVRVSTVDLARRLKTTERDAEDRLERCLKAGAVERRRRIAQAPVFVPLARGPVSVTKQERDLVEVRNAVADTVARINGQPVPQRAKAETSTFPAGSVMRGLRGRA